MPLVERSAMIRHNPLRWRHNDHDGVSNHQPHGCLLNCLFRRRSKKTPKLRVTCLCAGKSPGPVNSPHKGPVTRKRFPFDDVVMLKLLSATRTPENSAAILSTNKNTFEKMISELTWNKTYNYVCAKSTLFWRNNDAIITSCVRWVLLQTTPC